MSVNEHIRYRLRAPWSAMAAGRPTGGLHVSMRAVLAAVLLAIIQPATDAMSQTVSYGYFHKANHWVYIPPISRHGDMAGQPRDGSCSVFSQVLYLEDQSDLIDLEESFKDEWIRVSVRKDEPCASEKDRDKIRVRFWKYSSKEEAARHRQEHIEEERRDGLPVWLITVSR